MAALPNLPRDVEGWSAAVVLSVQDKTATVGVEGSDAPAEIPAKDVTWARKQNKDKSLGPKAKTPAIWSAWAMW